MAIFWKDGLPVHQNQTAHLWKDGSWYEQPKVSGTLTLLRSLLVKTDWKTFEALDSVETRTVLNQMLESLQVKTSMEWEALESLLVQTALMGQAAESLQVQTAINQFLESVQTSTTLQQVLLESLESRTTLEDKLAKDLSHTWNAFQKYAAHYFHTWSVLNNALEAECPHTWNVLRKIPDLRHRWSVKNPEIKTGYGADIQTPKGEVSC